MFGDEALRQAAEEASGEKVQAHVEAKLKTAADRFGKRGLLCATPGALVFVEDALLEPGQVTVVRHGEIHHLRIDAGGIFADLHVTIPDGELHFADLDKRHFDTLLEAADLPTGGEPHAPTPELDAPGAVTAGGGTPDGAEDIAPSAPRKASAEVEPSAAMGQIAGPPKAASTSSASQLPQSGREGRELEPKRGGNGASPPASASAHPESIADLLEGPGRAAAEAAARDEREPDRFTERCASCGVGVVDAYYSSYGDPLCRRCFNAEEVSISTEKAAASMQTSGSTSADAVKAVKVAVGIFILFVYLALRTC